MTRNQSYYTIAMMCIALLVLAGNAVLSVRNIRELGDRAYWVEHTQSVLMDLETTRAEVSRAISNQRAYLLTDDAQSLDASTNARQSTDKLLADLAYLIQDNPQQLIRLSQMRRLRDAVFANLDETTRLKKSSTSFPTASVKLIQDSKITLDQLRATILEMIDAENVLLKQRKQDSEASLGKTIGSVAIATVAAMGMVVLAFVTLRLSVRASTRATIEQNRLANYNTLLVNSTGEGMYGVDLSGNCTFINKAGEKILGVKAADVIGKRMHDITHHHKPDGTPYPANECPIYKSYITGEGTRVDDEVFFRADGSSFPVEYSANPIVVGRRTEGAVVSFNDITQRLKNDAERRESGERAQALADNISQLAWMADGKGAIFWYNRRWFEYTGTTLEEMRGFGWKTVHHPDYVEQVSRKFAAAITAGTAWEDTFPLLAKDGNYRWFLSRATPIVDENGKVLRWFGTNTDITEQRETQQKLIDSQDHLRKARDEAEEARAEAEAANVAKSQFLANMSHELRTPLNAVIMYSELLQEEAQDRGINEFVPDLEKIRAGGKHLLSLVNGVLDLSKIEAGKMELYLETFDVKTMVDEVASTVKPLVDRRGNELKIEIAADVGPLYADLTKVRQILFNLLSNATKFTDKGTITLQVKREVNREISAGKTSDNSGSIIFRIADSGIGMTQEQTARLFQPFMQADASTTRKYGGTGLGLAISLRFCAMMGGTITVDSEPGTGSIFTVRLPAHVIQANSDPVAPAIAPAGAPLSAAQPLVLVVDDEPGVRDMVTRALGSSGEVRTVTAVDGADGLRKARDLRPDLILLDVMMPKLDGWAVLTSLKSDPAVADIPVVMMTMVNDQEMGYVLGASEYLTKPIDRDRLVSLIGKYAPTDGQQRNVLVVEDDVSTRDVLRRSLEREGWVVDEAANGRVALERLRSSKPPVLILLDLIMPEMDGFSLLGELRREPAWSAIPAVVITSKDLTVDERGYLQGKVEGILQKGAYSRDAMLSEVRKIISRCVKRNSDGTESPCKAPFEVGDKGAVAAANVATNASAAQSALEN